MAEGDERRTVATVFHASLSLVHWCLHQESLLVISNMTERSLKLSNIWGVHRNLHNFVSVNWIQLLVVFFRAWEFHCASFFWRFKLVVFMAVIIWKKWVHIKFVYTVLLLALIQFWKRRIFGFFCCCKCYTHSFWFSVICIPRFALVFDTRSLNIWRTIC